MPIYPSRKALKLMEAYREQLLKLMRQYARKGLDYVEVERATMQALLGANWEFNEAELIELRRFIRSRKNDR